MKTWILAIVLFGIDGHAEWRYVRVPGLTEVACLELLGNVATSNPKGRGLAYCANDGALGEGMTEAMPQMTFSGR